MADLIQTRRDTYDNWWSTNPTLANGEVGIITHASGSGNAVALNPLQCKVGDGSTTWRNLATQAWAEPGLSGSINQRINQVSGSLHTELNLMSGSLESLEDNIGHYTCTTAGGTAAKVISAADASNYTRITGGSLKIKFNSKNTAASGVTLKVGNAAAANLYYDGAPVTNLNTWEAGETVDVYFDGQYYMANNVSGGGTFATGQKVKNVGIDDEPTADSNKLVKSGGVEAEFSQLKKGQEIFSLVTKGGNTITKTKFLYLQHGKQYQLRVLTPNWDVTGVTYAKFVASIRNVSDDADVQVVASVTIQKTVNPQYTFTVPSSGDIYLYFQVRGVANQEIKFVLEQVIDEALPFNYDTITSNAVLNSITDFMHIGKYINSQGIPANDSSWFYLNYTLSTPLSEGDVIVWDGIYNNANRYIAFFNNTQLLNVKSANGTKRTITLSSGDLAIGANKISASFYLTNQYFTSLSVNGVILVPTIITPQQYVDNLVALVNTKTLTGYYKESEIDSMFNVGVFIRDKSEAQFTSKLLFVYNSGNVYKQTLISTDSFIQTRTYNTSNNTWSAWTSPYLENKSIDSQAIIDSTNLISSGGVYASLLKLYSEYNSIYTLPTLESGSIRTNGTDTVTTGIVRIPNNHKLSIIYPYTKVFGNLSVAQSIISNASAIMVNIHCYKVNGDSIGRTTLGYQDVSNKNILYPLLPDTALIRLTMSFLNQDGVTIQDISSYVEQINSNLSSLLTVANYAPGINEIVDIKDTLSKAENIPTENSTNLITSGGVYNALHKSYEYSYIGDKIDLRRTFNASLYMDNINYGGASGQGCISYKDYLLVGSAGGYLNVYSLVSKTQVAAINLASQNSNNHVNNLSFGVEGDSNNTEFEKYLYISACGDSTNNDNNCYVENLTLSGSTLIQTISYTGTKLDVFEWVVDYNNKIICAIGQTAIYSDPNNKIRVLKFRLPLISEGSTITFTDSDIIEQFEYIGTKDYMYIFQGVYYYNGKLYFSCGGYDNGTANMPHNIFVINLFNGEVESLIDISKVYKRECESITVYNEKMLACFPNQHNIYMLEF